MRKHLLLLFLLTITSLAWAQMPTDLSKIKVSELSDDQIRDIVKQGEARGLNITDGENLALSMGLPAAEALAFKTRLAGMGSNPIKETVLTPVAAPAPAKNILKPAAVVPRPEVQTEVVALDGSKPALYGRSIYQSGNLQLMGQATDTKAPDTYVLGPGDELVVSVFGVSYANEVVKIDSKGAARVKGMGTLYLTGLTFEAARKLIRAKFGQYYDLNNNQLEITLLFSRVIKVNVVGEVNNPGTYEFSALNSVFNALLAAGGPSEAGSVRQIEVQRAGKVVYRFDTYHFLAGKLSNKPFSLEDQDYIVVKALGSIVELEGAVRRPATYELLPSEGLEALIDWAGGLSSNAYQGSIQRITFANGAREVKEFQMTAGKMPLDSLRDGDQILVRGLPDDVRNALEIDGDVNQPGSYTFEPNITVYELIRRAGGLKPTAYMQKAFLSRRKTDASREMIALDLNGLMADSLSGANIKLQPYDKLLVASKSDLIDTYDIQVIGAVRKPGAIEYASGLTLGDLLLQVGGLKPEADVKRIEIIRISLFDEQKKAGSRIFTVSVEVENGELKGADLSKMLMPYDRVYVRTLADFMSPASVTLTGEFNFPGTYALLSRDERVSDLIQRAGGLKPYAFVEAAKFYRQTAPGGQVLLDLSKVLRSLSSRYNYRLQDGDSISVPEFVPYVSIQGLGVQYLNTTGLEAVNAPFKTGLRADGFVKRYGDGFSERANKRRLFVVAADDKVSRTRSYLGLRVYPKVTPGATIYVMEKEITKREKEKGEPVNWNRVIENTTVKLTGLATLYLLFSQINR
ncbi:MAG: SLBB domain-containing protein [Sphingobacteriaceae bacterium]|nr:SLBB domain-containing protein [Sphingobacteriaceae bacterium]